MSSSLISDGPNLTAFSACFQQPQALCERKYCNFSIFLIRNLDDNFIFPLFQYMIFSYSRCDNMKKAHTQKTICVRALVTRCHLNYKRTIPLYISALSNNKLHCKVCAPNFHCFKFIFKISPLSLLLTTCSQSPQAPWRSKIITFLIC